MPAPSEAQLRIRDRTTKAMILGGETAIYDRDRERVGGGWGETDESVCTNNLQFYSPS